MLLTLQNPNREIEKVTDFIQSTLKRAHKKNVVIAVSGGIDSALSLGLLSKTIPLNNIYPIFLPYDKQDMGDAKLLSKHLNIPGENWQEVNIEKIVNTVAKLQEINSDDHLRLGNIMARSRMIVVYDLAKKLNALVCGTENKSEKYLGYFTRFGDEASDFEPIVHLYKTQVRQLVESMELPEIFLTKDPSAGLWEDQTDEQELGFSYKEADLIIDQIYFDKMALDSFLNNFDIDEETVDKVINRVNSVKFKHQVPYTL
ncbi:MAG: NAD+ synthase [Candidatus Pacebacteria bacterium]|nr:NAD+ synthase [Candidatus Paceibacterota bacterium]